LDSTVIDGTSIKVTYQTADAISRTVTAAQCEVIKGQVFYNTAFTQDSDESYTVSGIIVDGQVLDGLIVTVECS
jgi:hypothetical protein